MERAASLTARRRPPEQSIQESNGRKGKVPDMPPSRKGSSPHGRNPRAGFGAVRRIGGCVEPDPALPDAPALLCFCRCFQIRGRPVAASPSFSRSASYPAMPVRSPVPIVCG